MPSVLVLPPAIESLVEELARMPGVEAVMLGGSRAEGTADAGSDWDLALYYRGALDASALHARGEVHPPGSWGRIMNGGAWLEVEGLRVDVLLRDLDVVGHWCVQAEAGAYEVDFLLSYLAGIPTYSLAAELAVGRLLRGSLPDLPATRAYPARLAELAPPRWMFHARFNLYHARSRALRGDAAGTLGQAARACVEIAHARLCAARTWQLNEKRILERAGLGALQAHFSRPSPPQGLVAWLDALEAALAVG